MADKEQALILAAQFGKTLIDEKEDLEKQIENIKREHQVQLEVIKVLILIRLFISYFLSTMNKNHLK